MEENSIPPIADTLLSSNNEELIRRRQDVATYLYSGKPVDELADRYGVSVQAIKNDVKIVKSFWQKFAAQGIDEFTNQEIAFSMEQRSSALEQWNAYHKGQMQMVVLQWSKHIAEILGLYSPTKNINLNVSFDEYAKNNGVDLHQVSVGLVKELSDMIKSGTAQLTDEELSPLLEAIQGRAIDVTPLDNPL